MTTLDSILAIATLFGLGSALPTAVIASILGGDFYVRGRLLLVPFTMACISATWLAVRVIVA